MQQLMQQMFVQVQQSNERNANRIEQNSATLQELWKAIDENTTVTIDEHDWFAVESQRSHSLQAEQLSAWNNDCVEFGKTNEASVQQMLDHNSKEQAMIDERQTELMVLLTTQTEAIQERINRLQTEIAELDSSATATFTTDTEQSLANLRTASTRQENWNSVSVSLHNNMAREIGEYGETVASQVLMCRDRLETFHRNDLQTYRSTGETPVKREFNYPKQLAQTSPHDRLVRRFWTNFDGTVADLDCSVTICEGSESTFIEGITDDRSSSILLARPEILVTPHADNHLSRAALQQLPGSNVLNSIDTKATLKPGARRCSSASTSPVSRSRSNSGNRKLSSSGTNKENVC